MRCAVDPSIIVRRTSRASLPKLKKEKKYCPGISHYLKNFDRSYLIDCIRFVTVDDTDFEGIGEVNDGALLNINDVFNGKRDFYAVAVIMRSKDDFLQSLHPFFCACRTVRFEVINTLVRDHRKVLHFLALVLTLDKRCGNAISQVDVSAWEIEVRLIHIV